MGSGERMPFFAATGKTRDGFQRIIWQLDELGGWKNTKCPAPKKFADASRPARGTPDIPDAHSSSPTRRRIYWIVAGGSFIA